MKSYRKYLILISLIALAYPAYKYTKKVNLNTALEVGQVIDSFNGVYIYYNGGVGHTAGRNLSTDGYNMGIKYQCVEFVKRYYYQFYKHKMPDTYGNAKDFFDNTLPDSSYNKKRGLTQYANHSITSPRVGDLIIFDGTVWNKYGHVAIVANVSSDSITIIQQNGGPFAKSRVGIPLRFENGSWHVQKDNTLGWLRKE